MPKTPALSKKGEKLAGKTIVFAGHFQKLDRDAAERLLEEVGAKVRQKVSGRTDILIIGSRPGSQPKRAEENDVTIWNEDMFLQQIDAQTGDPRVPDHLRGHFPNADKEGPLVTFDSRMLMRTMAETSDPIGGHDWSVLVRSHRRFLRSGGRGGSWQVRNVSGLALGVYTGARGRLGAQADLQRKRISRDVMLRRLSLPFANFCASMGEDLDMSWADLSYGLWTDAFYTRTRFEHADLTGCDFARAELRQCSFRHANLTAANFENTDLTGCDFTGATLNDASFVGATLTDVIVEDING